MGPISGGGPNNWAWPMPFVTGLLAFESLRICIKFREPAVQHCRFAEWLLWEMVDDKHQHECDRPQDKFICIE